MRRVRDGLERPGGGHLSDWPGDEGVARPIAFRATMARPISSITGRFFPAHSLFRSRRDIDADCAVAGDCRADRSVPEAEALGVQLARLGSLASVLPVLELKETDELLESMPGLAAGERLKLRMVAHRVAVEGSERLLRAEGRALAERLSIADLRALIAFAESAPAQRMRAAEPAVTIATMEAMRGFAYKEEVIKAFCKETGKACPQK
ncbi:DUF2059 domain-containing protein [Sphingomonas changnyeongensis]|uniref:DUF2059 domain-containing protein n=1 Tax=Sphingomonas changnyeongensis TaxID=2698679 RepID=UPI001E4C4B94|nr:DUF2059 domain-containing protein [Sphingomonas changnyeongensis]